MKKVWLLFIVSLLWGYASHAQQLLELHTGNLQNSLGSTVPTRDVQEVADGYLVTYTFDKATILPDHLFSGTVFWKMDGFGLNSIDGEPSTLVRNDWLSVPSGCSVKVEVTDSTYRDYSYTLTPARKPLVNSSKEQYSLENVSPIRPYHGFKPASVASLASVQSYRGNKLCLATIAPIQYNYERKTVRAYTSITYKVTFERSRTEKVRANTVQPYMSVEDNLIGNIAIGSSKTAKKRNAPSNGGAPSDVRDYLILSTSKYKPAVERFAAWKRLLGFNVDYILKEDWSSDKVKEQVSKYYASYPALYYLLIVGDHEDVPGQVSKLWHPHVTDFYYRCLDKSWIPDIYAGRLPVSTIEEANTVVDKIIDYERNPPSDSSFYNRGLNCASFEDLGERDTMPTYADRRYAQTSEDVRNYMMMQGKEVQRVYYTQSKVNPKYWNKGKYSNGEPIPDELRKPKFAWNGNATDIVHAINQGVFYALHRGHGFSTIWGGPLFTQYDVSSLANGNLLPVIFSINCSTGQFDANCICETFLRKSNGGCVAIYGATEKTYSGPNEVMLTGMFDAIWPDPGLSISFPNKNNTHSPTPTPCYTLGQILEQGQTRVAETYAGWGDPSYSNEVYHCFGDPSMQIYTACPTPFTDVKVLRSDGKVTVTLGNGETARITTFDPVAYRVKSCIGNSMEMSTNNMEGVAVCVSAHNRIPFVEDPDIKFIQKSLLYGEVEENHKVIKVGNHVTPAMPDGDVTTTSDADITLRANKIVLDRGTYIHLGSKLKIITP